MCFVGCLILKSCTHNIYNVNTSGIEQLQRALKVPLNTTIAKLDSGREEAITFLKKLWITMVFPSFFPANTPSPPLPSSSSPLWFYVLFISFYFFVCLFLFLFCFLFYSRFNLSALIRIGTTKSVF